MNFEDASALVSQVKHWHHRIELLPGLVTPGSYDPTFLLEKLRLPPRLDGSRVLDVGTSDGYFARELGPSGHLEGTITAGPGDLQP
jgi:tRNA (mo5U34)-methyltransferase